ncbi:MAG: aminoacyl-tRNA hydrolase [Candidatus Azotimanducaceae bacterium WSBS_2022_MAG_OTU7]
MSGLTQADSTSAGSTRPLKLIAGIGNPGADYANTRHNAGVWFVERLAQKFGASFKPEKKFFGRTSLISVGGTQVLLLIPDTYMNESGKSVAALANFFKIEPPEILVAHDEIDFPSGKIRFKQAGGLAGHNGLRDISSRLAGATGFNRLRIGVGHPGDRGGVTGHVLGKVSKKDRELIGNCIEDAIAAMPSAVTGDWQLAMQQLHNL